MSDGVQSLVAALRLRAPQLSAPSQHIEVVLSTDAAGQVTVSEWPTAVAAAADAPAPPAGPAFPEALGPFAVLPTTLRLTIQSLDSSMYEAALTGELAPLAHQGLWNVGSFSPPHPITLSPADRTLARIPQEAASFVWAYPLAGMSQLTEASKAALDMSSANMCFLSLGGYVYLNAAEQVIQANAIGAGDGLAFLPPQPWKAPYSRALVSSGRCQDITIDFLRAQGARYYCWIRPGEALPGGDGDAPWAPCQDGAFAYFFSDDAHASDPRDCFFAIGTDELGASTIVERAQAQGGVVQAFSSFSLTPQRRAAAGGAAAAAAAAASAPPLRELAVGRALLGQQTEAEDADMRRRLADMQSVALCVVCLENHKAVLFVPCHHLCACAECATQLRKCPICRASISSRIDVFS